MPNVKNRRIVIGDTAYRWSSLGTDWDISISVGLEGEDRRPTGRRILSGVPHHVNVTPALVRRLIEQARDAGWNPNEPTPKPFRSPLAGPFEKARAQEEKALVDDQAHLTAIRAAPDDDAPRLVYADWLLERGDPRGEHIILSIAAHTRALSDDERRRLRQLETEHEGTWLGPIVYVTRERQWERGFLSGAELARGGEMIAPAIGDARWWSVQRLDASADSLAPADVAHILGRTYFHDLLSLKLSDDALLALVREKRGWLPRALEVSPTGPRALEALAEVAHLPRLRHLRVASALSPGDRALLDRPGLSLSW